MVDVLFSWSKSNKFDKADKEKLIQLRNFAGGYSEDKKDLRQLSSKWTSYVRNFEMQRDNDIPKNKIKNIINRLKENPPENISDFSLLFEDVNFAEDIDTRTISMIAGIPDSK